MAGLAYDVSIGGLRVSNSSRGGTQLLSLWSALTLDGGGGHCAMEFSASELSPPTPKDKVAIRLDGGSGSASVFTGQVREVSATAMGVRVTASDGLIELSRIEVASAYKDSSAGSIVKELLQKAGLSSSSVQDGPKFVSYALHPGPSALHHITRLAESCGFDFFTDGEGKVHFQKPRSSGVDHTFTYGEQVLDFELRRAQHPREGVVVWGEGAAGSKGADKAHWLTANPSKVSGKASLGASGDVRVGSAGEHTLQVRDGAVRSRSDAEDQARGRMGQVAARAVEGFLRVTCSPAVKPGDLVKLDKLPRQHPASALVSGQVLRVRTVRHTVNLRQGYVTRMEF
ncbi:contractile injection system protein, VgrG/Pvc8 family [Archangium violaceum]|uniref:contractile injection system protein, VgrG/Pvc8 family n=1 Tax=Archangium violaceum TaxID=83451 RepID=UPI002B326059|nr:contractile injection system protein, VgrG/Pvc8 family [Archangium gephyra]